MPSVRGKAAVKAYIGSIPRDMDKLLRGAARVAAMVVADEARDRVISEKVRSAIKVASSSKDGRIIAKVQVKGKGAYIAPWLEYGTSPHFISVDPSQRMGMSVGRINKRAKEGSLMIGGNFVGSTVHHPGARPVPFLRPALDTKEAAAVAAAQEYINSRVGPQGIAAPSETEGA